MNARSFGNDSTLVVKVGGTQGVNFAAVCADVADLVSQGKRLVLVHGGSTEANRLGEQLNIPPRFITSPSGYTSRYTDRNTLEVFLMAVNGKINALLVEQLRQLGVNALGLSGLDGGLLRASRKENVVCVENGKRKVLHGDYTGRIEQVNLPLLHLLLDGGYLPVIAPLAVSPNGEVLNVDADRAAASLAAALNAEALILLTAAPGLLEKFPDEATLIRFLPRTRLADALEMSQGRMKKKVLATEEALQGGVRQVIIADGRCEKPILQALGGNGTVIQ
jgi:acetylglutamate/LysW-gamma-L-alpha-aminoadipate kinase